MDDDELRALIEDLEAGENAPNSLFLDSNTKENLVDLSNEDIEFLAQLLDQAKTTQTPSNRPSQSTKHVSVAYQPSKPAPVNHVQQTHVTGTNNPRASYNPNPNPHHYPTTNHNHNPNFNHNPNPNFNHNPNPNFNHYPDPNPPQSHSVVPPRSVPKAQTIQWSKRYVCKSCNKEMIVRLEDLKKYSYQLGKAYIDWFFRCPNCPRVIIIVATSTLDCLSAINIGLLPGKVANEVPYVPQPGKDYVRQDLSLIHI
eukprot:TRINITY_DN4201_c0_g1_i6.p1 TRINITY_DN4201_c0_g1~~TRINITY_DN4201_c0_g1_i6.p1  ORF type:complete len:255 (-),score=35.56 TRINITY_DN4201_c0_g1_i6:23-787(-)